MGLDTGFDYEAITKNERFDQTFSTIKKEHEIIIHELTAFRAVLQDKIISGINTLAEFNLFLTRYFHKSIYNYYQLKCNLHCYRAKGVSSENLKQYVINEIFNSLQKSQHKFSVYTMRDQEFSSTPYETIDEIKTIIPLIRNIGTKHRINTIITIEDKYYDIDTDFDELDEILYGKMPPLIEKVPVKEINIIRDDEVTGGEPEQRYFTGINIDNYRFHSYRMTFVKRQDIIWYFDIKQISKLVNPEFPHIDRIKLGVFLGDDEEIIIFNQLVKTISTPFKVITQKIDKVNNDEILKTYMEITGL
jgi:hypothetical protein